MKTEARRSILFHDKMDNSLHTCMCDVFFQVWGGKGTHVSISVSVVGIYFLPGIYGHREESNTEASRFFPKSRNLFLSFSACLFLSSNEMKFKIETGHYFRFLRFENVRRYDEERRAWSSRTSCKRENRAEITKHTLGTLRAPGGFVKRYQNHPEMKFNETYLKINKILTWLFRNISMLLHLTYFIYNMFWFKFDIC